MKKLLSLLLVGMFTWISFACANTVDISWDSENWYTPLVITIYTTWDISASDFSDFVCGNNATNCEMVFTTRAVDDGYSCKVYISNWNLAVNWTRCQNLVPNVYFLVPSNKTNKIPFSSIKFTSNLIDPPSEDSSDTPLLWWVWEDFASGITSWVWSLVSWFSNIIPTILLLWLPLLIITIFWNRIWSYLKHVLVWNKPRWDDIANCNLTVNKYWQFEHHIIWQHDRWDYVDIPWVWLVWKDELPYYLDENLNFKAKEYKQDHTTFDTRDPWLPGDDYYRRSENIEEEAYYYRKYL